NRKLAKAERAAAWREVARRVAHEIKNPLTPIKLSAQRLRRKYLSSTDSVFDECTQMIITQVDELKELVDEFSNFAKLPQVNLKPSQLSPIVKEAMAVYQEAHRHIAFEIKIDRDLPHLDLDRDQIKRVFINLIDNSVSAMTGGGRIVIAARYHPALQSVVVEVSDTGSGIPDGIKARIFDPNFSTKEGGTGLGLTIVKKIILDHQGYVRVVDNRPKGTKFIIELPIHSKMIESVYFDERPHLNRR
ncbi:MAG: ATP-binding protein, partial [Deltaproteobacteria bacterium]